MRRRVGITALLVVAWGSRRITQSLCAGLPRSVVRWFPCNPLVGGVLKGSLWSGCLNPILVCRIGGREISKRRALLVCAGDTSRARSWARSENVGLAIARRAVKLRSPSRAGVRRARDLGSAGSINDSRKRARERTGTVGSESGKTLYPVSQVALACQRNTSTQELSMISR